MSDGTRTRDRRDHNPELYQLSYAHREATESSNAAAGSDGELAKGPSVHGSRISRGWTLAKKSWAVLRGDRSLMLFPIVAGIASLLAAAILFAPGLALYYADRQEAYLIVFGILAVYAMTFVAVFFNTALAGAALKSLEGEDTSFADGIAVARSRVGIIAAWALVQTTVGIILNAIQALLRDNAIVGALLSGLLSFAWQVSTFFVIPILAVEGLGPVEAIKRSVAILKQRWGEGLVGQASIGGIIFLIGFLPAAAVGVVGYALLSSSEAVGVALLVAAAIVVAIAALVGSTLTAIFRVALFIFATGERSVGGFETAELESAFAPKGQRRGGLAGA